MDNGLMDITSQVLQPICKPPIFVALKEKEKNIAP